ncbi:MAG: gluconate 2-dehydrogenase subunit 3 family protein [Candidatus Solibacter sp.]|nr:gluconate 2-dehydrogenase subunit 3 family protein [Candidatus Solibacter sp.]
MDHAKINSLRRRRFLRIAGTATACGALASCGRESTPWRFLTAAEGRTLAAICEQIIPTDQTPGAAWAGVVNFIDRQLMGPYRRQQGAYRSGLIEMDRAAAGKFGKDFAALDGPHQTALLQSLEGGAKRFFSAVIAHTMQGYYGDPRHGGNCDAVSWRMLGVPVIPIRGRNRYELPKQGA